MTSSRLCGVYLCLKYTDNRLFGTAENAPSPRTQDRWPTFFYFALNRVLLILYFYKTRTQEKEVNPFDMFLSLLAVTGDMTSTPILLRYLIVILARWVGTMVVGNLE